MRADRHGRGVSGALLSLALLVSGCATMPSDGEVEKVASSERAEREPRVRVYGVGPQKDADAEDIVRGFLEATTSDEPRYRTAREYLTREAAKGWDPFAGTTVLERGPITGVGELNEGENGGYTVAVSGQRTARLDSRHAYRPDSGTFRDDFHLTEVKGEGWRIDRLPDGLVLGESDFERIYRSVDTYYFARLGPSGDSVIRGQDVMVAQPVYVRSRIEPVAETVRALLDGPTAWLDPVVRTAFPDDTALDRGNSVTVQDSGAVTVRLNKAGASAGGTRCERMAAQVLHSVQSQASSEVTSVELQGPRGDEVCTLAGKDASNYAPNRLDGAASKPYLVDEKHRVTAVAPGSDGPRVVTGLLGSGRVQFRSVGVSRDERLGAAVTRDGRALYVASLASGGDAGTAAPVLVSGAAREQDRLSAPSWDGLGDLWIADRDPRDPRLLRLPGGKGEPEVVSVPGLARNERIESLRISSDGVRIALRIRNPDRTSSLYLGRVEREGTREDPSVTVAALQRVAPQLADVGAMSWAGPSELVVLGREKRSVQQLQYVGTDGSTVHQPPLPGISDVENVAASENGNRPLLAESDYGIVRLTPPDGDWETVTEGGSAPVYPG